MFTCHPSPFFQCVGGPSDGLNPATTACDNLRLDDGHVFAQGGWLLALEAEAYNSYKVRWHRKYGVFLLFLQASRIVGERVVPLPLYQRTRRTGYRSCRASRFLQGMDGENRRRFRNWLRFRNYDSEICDSETTECPDSETHPIWVGGWGGDLMKCLC